MAAAIYIRIQSPSTGPTISLLCAKTKVAPLKKLTIPRLELNAALILAKLLHYVRATLHVNIDSIHLWTDSSVALTWINSNTARWKDFVRNRVLQIQDLVPDAKWHHIPSKDNPADCASRGINTSQLINNTLWRTGPTWLSKSTKHWPKLQPLHDQACTLEAQPGLSFVATTSTKPPQWDLISRYSSIFRLLRITVIIFKATSRLKRVPDPCTSITPNDLERARKFWVKSTQAAYFAHELKTLSANQKLPHTHVLSRLTAFIDEEAILRVGGRLHSSQLDPESKHPAILPKNSPFTTLVIRHAHLKTLHGGVQLTLSTIRQT
ncbi:uncharacterized protein LOC118735037, partial [Rhagoletis pomonella]|uniref:uncharacterized protein LOC118735037 n=1 Tax=Rhagoletis pomonella TaxID=28610 RepID=UPI001786FD0A